MSRRLFLVVTLTLVFAVRAIAQSGPETTPQIVAAAASAPPQIAPGPFEPTWDSVKTNYKTPPWFADAKFGVMMHWGIYSVPAYASEWYGKHMYGNAGVTQWHT